jgi:hypothetical protein
MYMHTSYYHIFKYSRAVYQFVVSQSLSSVSFLLSLFVTGKVPLSILNNQNPKIVFFSILVLCFPFISTSS